MEQEIISGKNLFDKYYWALLIIPLVVLFICIFYLFSFYQQNSDIIYKDVSLSGGTTITLNAKNIPGLSFEKLESELGALNKDVSLRKLTDLKTGSLIAVIIDSLEGPESIKPEIEKIINAKLTEENSSTEFSGPSLGKNFYNQLVTALAISFLLMSIVIFVMFRTFIPSIAVILAAFSDIIVPLAILNYAGIRISAAGIAAFLMLIGYSVDTDILLTTRAIKNREGRLNTRLLRAFKTGIFMTVTALLAVTPVFFLVTGLPDSFRQIFLILALGLSTDIISTWMTNLGIIKWYCARHKID